MLSSLACTLYLCFVCFPRVVLSPSHREEELHTTNDEPRARAPRFEEAQMIKEHLVDMYARDLSTPMLMAMGFQYTPPAFRIGQPIYHKTLGFRGVVLGWSAPPLPLQTVVAMSGTDMSPARLSGTTRAARARAGCSTMRSTSSATAGTSASTTSVPPLPPPRPLLLLRLVTCQPVRGVSFPRQPRPGPPGTPCLPLLTPLSSSSLLVSLHVTARCELCT